MATAWIAPEIVKRRNNAGTKWIEVNVCYYAVKHTEVFEIIEIAETIVRHELELRSGHIKGVEKPKVTNA